MTEQMRTPDAQVYALPEIPVLDTGPGFALETLQAFPERAHRLLDLATRWVPDTALRQLDRISRRWLKRWDNDHLPEIDAIAAFLDRPGAHFFSVNYEWGCTCRVAPAPNGQSARLARVLDWRTPGLGQHLIAANVETPLGPFTTLTWPGYTGVLSANAHGRFAAALNQAPMRRATGVYALDWMVNRRRVWNAGHETPAHLLRRAFERAPNFFAACTMLTETPLSTPAIFLIAGTEPDATAIIERREKAANVLKGPGVAANHWQAAGWRGRPRGHDSAGRAAQMHQAAMDWESPFTWVRPPILNNRTRLVMLADAQRGATLAQGFEGLAPATAVLKIGSA